MNSFPDPIPVITGPMLLPQMLRIQSDTLGFILETTRRYGDLVHFDLGMTHAFLISRPSAIQHVLQDNHRNYTKDTIQYNSLATITGRGLLTSDGDLWFRHRRLEQPAFAKPRLAALDLVVVPAVQEMLERWTAGLAFGSQIDVDREMMRVTLEVVGKTLFGIDLSREAHTLTSAVLTCLDHIVYKARMMIAPPDSFPTLRNIRFHRALHTLNKAVYELIDVRQQRGGDLGDDLLGMLLRARDPDSGDPLSRIQLRDEVITLLIAGHETVASALTWTFYLLAEHRPAWEELHAEVQRVLGGRPPTGADVTSLTFTGQVFDEALRLYPPAWLITRKAVKEDDLDGEPVPAGALIIISPYAVHRNPAVWQAPEDFDPGRFAGGADNQRSRYGYIPFGAGPRLCIGNQFALIEARLVLAMVAQRFRLDLPPASVVRPDPLVTIRPRGGLPMRLIPIK